MGIYSNSVFTCLDEVNRHFMTSASCVCDRALAAEEHSRMGVK